LVSFLRYDFEVPFLLLIFIDGLVKKDKHSLNFLKRSSFLSHLQKHYLNIIISVSPLNGNP